MKILYAQPPLNQREGGLEKAIEGWRKAFLKVGVETVLLDRTEQLAGDAVVNFHGLWQPQHSAWSSVCRQKGIKYVVTPHGMLEPWAWKHKWWKKWPYYVARERQHLTGASVIGAASALEAENLKIRLPKSRIEILPLGTEQSVEPGYSEARNTLGWSEEDWVLLFLSRIDPKKGLEVLFQALSEVRNDWPKNFRMTVVGRGQDAYESKLRKMASQFGIPVEWVGAKGNEEKWKYLQGADLFCLPTYSENFAYAVLEACLVGTPVLTTTTTPWKKLEELKFGWIAEPESGSLAEKLKKIFKSAKPNEKFRLELAQWSRKNFLWENVISQHVKIFEELGR